MGSEGSVSLMNLSEDSSNLVSEVRLFIEIDEGRLVFCPSSSTEVKRA